MTHYAVKDMLVRCEAVTLDQWRFCEFASRDQNGLCVYRQIDGVCTSPEAFARLTDCNDESVAT